MLFFVLSLALLICVNSQDLLLAEFYDSADTTCSGVVIAQRYFETQAATRQCGAGYTYGSPVGAMDYLMVDCSNASSTIVYGNCYFPHVQCSTGWCACPGSCEPYDRELTLVNNPAQHQFGAKAHLGECIYVESYWNEFFYVLLNLPGFDALRTGSFGPPDSAFSTNVVFSCPGAAGTCGADTRTDPGVCTAHGTCIGPDVCECDAFTESDDSLRYSDTSCQDYECADGELMSDAVNRCSGRGNCDAGDAPGSPCVCDDVNDIPETHCAEHYCADSAYPVCSGHGGCSAPAGPCVCSPADEFGGADCSVFVCEDGNLTSDAAACNGRGFCSSGGGPCECDDMTRWGGPLCAYWRCEDGELYTADGTVCGGHGTCSSPLGVCECEEEYGGSECSEFLCADGELSTDAANVCSGHGSCSEAGGACTCTDDYWGANCQLAPAGSNALIYQIVAAVVAPVVVIAVVIAIIVVIVLVLKCRGAAPSKKPDVPVVKAVEMETEKETVVEEEKHHSSSHSSSSSSSSDD